MDVCMKIRLAQPQDEQVLIRLIAGFRQSLAQLRGGSCGEDLAAAKDELYEYLGKAFPVYVAENETAAVVGYLVCRVDGDVVWAESLYVLPEYRRHGVAAGLYAEAERLAQELGNSPPYNWVDPDNDTIIRFLQKRGYNVLNLIELRRPQPGEEPARKIHVGRHEFDRG